MNQLSSPLYWMRYSWHCALYIIHCTLYTVHYTLYILQSTLKTVHCILLTVHNTLYPISISARWSTPLVLLMCIYRFMRWTMYICCSISYTLNYCLWIWPSILFCLLIWLISRILSISSLHIINRPCVAGAVLQTAT